MSVEKELISKVFGDSLTEEQLKDDNFNVDEFVSDWKQSQKEKHIELFKNDPGEFKDQIVKDFEGRQHALLDRMYKKLGGDPKEFEGKSPTEKINAALELHQSSLKTASKKDTQELQEKIRELAQKNQEYEETVIPKIKQEEQAKVNSLYSNHALRQKYDSVINYPLITDQRDAAINLIDSRLKEKYDIEWDNESKDIVFREKGSDKIAMTKDGNDFLTHDQIINSVTQELGLPKKSNGDGGGQEPKRQPSQPNNTIATDDKDWLQEISL